MCIFLLENEKKLIRNRTLKFWPVNS